MNPTPLDTPGERERAFIKSEQTKLLNVSGKTYPGPHGRSVGSQPTSGSRAEPASLNLSHHQDAFACISVIVALNR